MNRVQTLILIGMPGSGKSTVGKALSESLGWQLIDGDDLIEAVTEEPLQATIDRLGIDSFLKLEADILSRYTPTQNTVLAPGGSAVYSEQAMQHLTSLGTCVYLEVSLPDLEARLHNFESRGIVKQPGQSLADIYLERLPLYQRYANVVIPAGMNPQHTVNGIENSLDK